MTDPVNRKIPRELQAKRAAVAIPRKQPLGYGDPSVIVLNTRPIEPPVKQARQPSPGDLTAGQAVGRALIFLGLVAIGALFLIAAAGLLFASLIDGMALLGLIVGAGTLALLVTLGVNRTNHSGACPGIITHCRGCKH